MHLRKIAVLAILSLLSSSSYGVFHCSLFLFQVKSPGEAQAEAVKPADLYAAMPALRFDREIQNVRASGTIFRERKLIDTPVVKPQQSDDPFALDPSLTRGIEFSD